MEIVLFFFGLFNAGVEFNAIGEATWLVLAGMRTIDLLVIGCVAAIGLTASLFIASVAFDGTTAPQGTLVQDAAKMGALLLFAAAGISIIAGKLCRAQSNRTKTPLIIDA